MADIDIDLSDLSDELESDLLPRPQLQHQPDENADVSPECRATSSPHSDNLIALSVKSDQRKEQQWHLLQPLPEALVPTQDPQEGSSFSQVTETSPTLWQASQMGPVAEERTEESDDMPSLKPMTVPAAATICLTVEDPYFDTPLGSPPSEEAPVSSIGDDVPDSWTANTPTLFLNDQTMALNSGKCLYCMCVR